MEVEFLNKEDTMIIILKIFFITFSYIDEWKMDLQNIQYRFF